jgi:acetylornithine deacetylase
VEAEIKDILQQRSQVDPAFHAVLRTSLSRSPLETPEDAAIIQAVSASAADVMGHPPELAGVAYWTDAASLWAAGIPSLLFGPSGGGAHAVEEWVELESVSACAEVYLETARRFCDLK